jgi:hypothetical protein
VSKKKRKGISKHHIIPRSRGGTSLEDNLALVGVREHQEYHALFDNKTPREIITYLNSYFWKSKYEIEVYERGQNRRNY